MPLMVAEPRAPWESGPEPEPREAQRLSNRAGGRLYDNGVTPHRQAPHYAPDVCYYCGLPAGTIDHVVPQSLLDEWLRLGDVENYQLATGRGRVLTVPACQQCNSILGAKYDPTLLDRKSRLKTRLRQKYRRVLGMPDWTPEQLAALGPRLRQHVEQGLRLRALIRRRIAW